MYLVVIFLSAVSIFALYYQWDIHRGGVYSFTIMGVEKRFNDHQL